MTRVDAKRGKAGRIYRYCWLRWYTKTAAINDYDCPMHSCMKGARHRSLHVCVYCGMKSKRREGRRAPNPKET